MYDLRIDYSDGRTCTLPYDSALAKAALRLHDEGATPGTRLTMIQVGTFDEDLPGYVTGYDQGYADGMAAAAPVWPAVGSIDAYGRTVRHGVNPDAGPDAWW